MKRKPKFLFKINRNNTAKVYANGKWQRCVTNITIYGSPFDYDIEIEKTKLKNGVPYVENNEIARETVKYHFGE